MKSFGLILAAILALPALGKGAPQGGALTPAHLNMKSILERVKEDIPSTAGKDMRIINKLQETHVWYGDTWVWFGANPGTNMSSPFGETPGFPIDIIINVAGLPGIANPGGDIVSGLEGDVFAAGAYAVLIHEGLHDNCPPHTPHTPHPPGYPTGPGSGPGIPPDCVDLKYFILTAEGLCDKIQQVGACLADPSCTGDLFPKEADPIEQVSLAEFCKALCERYAKLQSDVNNPINAYTAASCACSPYAPNGGPSLPPFTGCPDFPVPEGGCPAYYPDNKVIPDCECTCDCPDDGSVADDGSTIGD